MNIKNAITRGVDIILPSPKKLEQELLSGRKLNIYCGYDPTGPTLHLGHLFTILKLADFQALGHRITFLIGDFTGMIGDPTDKSEARKKLTRKEALKNSTNYKKLAQKFIKFSGDNPAKMLYNSQWNDKLSFTDLIELASNFTVQQMLVRDMFQDRIKRNKPIYLHEFLYPLAQGYDSVAMNTDLEIGGRDQLFNMLCGRDLVKVILNKEKFVLGTKLLVNPSGKKMSKSEGTVIALDDSPEMIYGKIMSWPDELIIPGLEGGTRIEMSEIKKIERDLKKGSLAPINAKAILAKEITRSCHNLKKAEEAEKEFNTVFREKKKPTKTDKVKIKKGRYQLLEVLLLSQLIKSKSEGRRLIEQGGVKINQEVKSDWQEMISIEKGMLIQVGKKRFIEID